MSSRNYPPWLPQIIARASGSPGFSPDINETRRFFNPTFPISRGQKAFPLTRLGGVPPLFSSAQKTSSTLWYAFIFSSSPPLATKTPRPNPFPLRKLRSSSFPFPVPLEQKNQRRFTSPAIPIRHKARIRVSLLLALLRTPSLRGFSP